MLIVTFLLNEYKIGLFYLLSVVKVW